MWTRYKKDDNSNVFTQELTFATNQTQIQFDFLTNVKHLLFNELNAFCIISLKAKYQNNLTFVLQAKNHPEMLNIRFNYSLFNGNLDENGDQEKTQQIVFNLNDFRQKYNNTIVENQFQNLLLTRNNASQGTVTYVLDFIFVTSDEINPFFHTLVVELQQGTTFTLNSEEDVCIVAPNVYFNNLNQKDIIDINTISWYRKNYKDTIYQQDGDNDIYDTGAYGWEKLEDANGKNQLLIANVLEGEDTGFLNKYQKNERFILQLSSFCEEEFICSCRLKNSNVCLVSESFTIVNKRNENADYSFNLKVKEDTYINNDYEAILTLDGSYNFGDDIQDSITYEFEWYYANEAKELTPIPTLQSVANNSYSPNSQEDLNNSIDITNIVTMHEKKFYFYCDVYVNRWIYEEEQWENSINRQFVCHRELLFDKHLQVNEIAPFVKDYRKQLKNLSNKELTTDNKNKYLLNISDWLTEKTKQNSTAAFNWLLENRYLIDGSEEYYYDFITIEEVYNLFYRYFANKYREKLDARYRKAFEEAMKQFQTVNNNGCSSGGYANCMYNYPYDMDLQYTNASSLGSTSQTSYALDLINSYNVFHDGCNWAPKGNQDNVHALMTVEDCVYGLYQVLKGLEIIKEDE